MEKTIILLAASEKYRNYCIAGIDKESGEWVRIISEDNDIRNAVTENDMRYEDGTLPQIFDIIQIQCKRYEPNFYQPENFVFDNSYYWIKIGNASLKEVLEIHPLEDTEYIFYNSGKRVDTAYLNNLPEKYKTSLTLISPSNVVVHVNQYEEKKISVSFNYNNERYSYLAVTDLDFKNTYMSYEVGNYTLLKKVLFVISLGEKYQRDNAHYKLIATVIET
jgi:hypothetical protein